MTVLVRDKAGNKVLCLWCDDENPWPLEIRESSEHSGLPSGGSAYGFKAACSGQGITNCPDTTGLCRNPQEATDYAIEFISGAE